VRAFITTVLILIGAAAQVQAQEDQARAMIGQDVFAAGYRVAHDGGEADDLFMAGNDIVVSAPASGGAALAAQTIEIDSPIDGDVYAFGQSIDISAPIGGDLTTGGQDIKIANVGGDVRAAGAWIELNGDVGGYAVLGGDSVQINGNIAGDLHLTGFEVSFADGVTIGGSLYLYEDEEGDISVPSSVAVSGNTERHLTEEFPEETERFVLKGFLSGVLFVAVVAALIAAVVPDRLARMRQTLLERPFGMLWFGFLGLSVTLGAAIVSALTIIGLVVFPFLLLIAGIGAFLGYVVGTYTLGVGLRLLIGMAEPETLMDRAITALAGALSVAIIALAPFIGWLFVLALTLGGIGVLINQLFSPRFFSS